MARSSKGRAAKSAAKRSGGGGDGGDARPLPDEAPIATGSTDWDAPTVSDSESEYADAIRRAYAQGNRVYAGSRYKLYKDSALRAALRAPVDPRYDVERVDARSLDAHAFSAEFERSSLPVLLTHAIDSWPARKEWTVEALDARFGHVAFAVGGTKCKLRHLLRYAKRNRDDNPMYLFDRALTGDKAPLVSDYTAPAVFRDDLFGTLPPSLRPPFRWFLIGPERSGSEVHVDPLGTSAWNALVQGHKRWVLFPPNVSLDDVTQNSLRRGGEGQEGAIFFWADVMPTLRRRARELGMIELIQRAGETLFVPSGWLHGVVNLDLTVCVTQNFVSRANLKRVWRVTRAERPRFASRWLKTLDYAEPAVAAKIRTIKGAESGSDGSADDSGWSAVDALPSVDADAAPGELTLARASTSGEVVVITKAAEAAKAARRRKRALSAATKAAPGPERRPAGDSDERVYLDGKTPSRGVEPAPAGERSESHWQRAMLRETMSGGQSVGGDALSARPAAARSVPRLGARERGDVDVALRAALAADDEPSVYGQHVTARYGGQPRHGRLPRHMRGVGPTAPARPPLRR